MHKIKEMKRITLVLVLVLSVSSFVPLGQAADEISANSNLGFQGIIPAPLQEVGGGKPTCNTVLSSNKDEAQKKAGLKGMDLGTKIQGGCVQLTDVPLIIIHLIDLFTKIAGSLSVAFILYAGFQLIMSGLTEDREAAKNTMKWAIVGLVVCLLAWVIVNLIQVQLTA